MSHTALITGSTSGIGAEFARQLASQGYNVVLVARTDDRLRAQAADLHERYNITAEVLVADLTTDDGVAAAQERIADQGHPVHVLINNAGHGIAGEFLDHDLDQERELLRLHVQTTMELTHTAARTMTARRGGRIINVASVAGHTATGTYSAAKSWVINFSKALHQQLKPSGVMLTVVSPGLVRTEFHQRSGITISGVKRWMWLEADQVVRQALTANAQGVAESVPSVPYRALTGALKFVPNRVVHQVRDRRMGMPDAPQEAEITEAEVQRRPKSPDNDHSD